MLEQFGLFLGGLGILVIGAELLIRGSVRIARSLGVSSFMIGFTLIGFGTSAPELVVCISAAHAGSPQIALGNVVGSNIANVGLILGIAAMIRPMCAKMRLLKIELPLMIGASLVVWFLCRDNTLSRGDGTALLIGFCGLTIYMYRLARAEAPDVKSSLEKVSSRSLPLGVAIVMVILGFAGLLGGAHLMVESAIAIARQLGVSEWLIGLTVVAVGTSLPEVAATVAAALRGESDIALGNVIGSNLFNILLVMGTTIVINPMRVSDQLVMQDMPVMALFSLLLVPFLLNGMRIHRYEGFVLLAAYTGFLVWQIERTQ